MPRSAPSGCGSLPRLPAIAAAARVVRAGPWCLLSAEPCHPPDRHAARTIVAFCTIDRALAHAGTDGARSVAVAATASVRQLAREGSPRRRGALAGWLG